MHTWGFFRGFDEAADTGSGLEGVLEELRHLDGGRRLVWIHLRSTDLPWTERGGRETLGLGDLYPYADPELPMPGRLRDRARDLYVDAVGRADRALGKILDAIEESGHRDETLLAGFWERWDGSLEPAVTFRPLEDYLSAPERGS